MKNVYQKLHVHTKVRGRDQGPSGQSDRLIKFLPVLVGKAQPTPLILRKNIETLLRLGGKFDGRRLDA
jgi:hypothetical protein